MKKIRLPPLGSLKAFDVVAQQRSFKRAAEDIGVTATAISHQIRVLEEALGTAVFERSTREVRLTAAGKILRQATRQAFAGLQAAVEEIHHAGLPAALTLTTTSNFLTHWLVPRLADLKAAAPEMDLRLHTGIELVDLTRNTVDVAIRYSESANESLDSTLLYHDTFVLVASPALALKTMEDLKEVTLFHVENRHIPHPSPDWENWKKHVGPAQLNTDSGLRFTDETHAIQAAIAGQGVAIVSSLLAHDFIEKGILTTPFPQYLPGANYYLVTAKEKALREDIVTLRRWLLDKMSAFPRLESENEHGKLIQTKHKC
ncbi:LysR substrate-binding domain-containing protein [Rahnella aceris]|uniref:LysR substrate-binding domain-containing protein n=1 Tax=Rahnella sp. (strain Y9602) TaxID=2703885 RepID=UPI001C2681D1|nr:LysR substrate-binding domain-containing protein [Rahnella aceris]MBU9852222.1 LysR family transcriptional regulator [Rahnella aceris]